MVKNLFLLNLGNVYWICFVKVYKGWFSVIIGVCKGLRCCIVVLMIFMLCVIIVNECVFLVNIGSNVIIVCL